MAKASLYEISLRWMSLDLTDKTSTLVQVMAWCRQVTSHYLSQCWPRYMSPYCNMLSLGHKELILPCIICRMGHMTLAPFSGIKRSIPWLLMPWLLVSLKSSTGILNIQILVFRKQQFQLPNPSQCWEMINCVNTFLSWNNFVADLAGKAGLEPMEQHSLQDMTHSIGRIRAETWPTTATLGKNTSLMKVFLSLLSG